MMADAIAAIIAPIAMIKAAIAIEVALLDCLCCDLLHQLTPVAAPYASVETRFDFGSGELVKFGEQLVAVHGHGATQAPL